MYRGLYFIYNWELFCIDRLPFAAVSPVFGARLFRCEAHHIGAPLPKVIGAHPMGRHTGRSARVRTGFGSDLSKTELSWSATLQKCQTVSSVRTNPITCPLRGTGEQLGWPIFLFESAFSVFLLCFRVLVVFMLYSSFPTDFYLTVAIYLF